MNFIDTYKSITNSLINEIRIKDFDHFYKQQHKQGNKTNETNKNTIKRND
jgi:hypothetical protein